MTNLKQVLMNRDGITSTEAEEQIDEVVEQTIAGGDPEELLQSELGLEPDYVFEILERMM